MNKTLLTILFLFATFTISAQKSDLIIGKWVFAKALNKDIDEAGLAYMKAEIIGKWKLDLKSDGKFNMSIMGEKASGDWKYKAGSKSIILNGIEGGPHEYEILSSTENELALKLGLGKFLLKRIEK